MIVILQPPTHNVSWRHATAAAWPCSHGFTDIQAVHALRLVHGGAVRVRPEVPRISAKSCGCIIGMEMADLAGTAGTHPPLLLVWLLLLLLLLLGLLLPGPGAGRGTARAAGCALPPGTVRYKSGLAGQ